MLTSARPESRRKLLRALAGCLALSLLAVACARKKPINVILISIDCLNERQLATALRQGYAPVLDALRRDSLYFERAYAHAPWTTPSHMSMLTGLYPSQHGRDLPYRSLLNHSNYYDRVPEFATLADLLTAKGWESAAFVSKGSVSKDFGTGQGFNLYEERTKGKKFTDLPEGVERIDSWLETRAGGPFFLFFHTFDLHDPTPAHLPVDDESVIGHIDRQLGNLFATLKDRELYEETLIFVTGDHGSRVIERAEKCCHHGVGHYEENVRVPLLVKLPGMSRTGVEKTLVRHVDLLPTALDVLGLPASGYSGPGGSILDRLDGDPTEETLSFSEADGSCARRSALVGDRYKYIYSLPPHHQELVWSPEFWHSNCPEICRTPPIEELYDLRRDRFEHDNLLLGALDPEAGAWLEKARSEMFDHLNLQPHYRIRVVSEPSAYGAISDDLEQVRDSLRALGYLD